MKPEALRAYFYLLLLTLISILFFRLLHPFFNVIIISTVITTLFYPFHQKILQKLGGRKGVATSISVFLIILLIVLPLVIILLLLVQQIFGLYQLVIQNELSLASFLSRLQSFIDQWKYFNLKIELANINWHTQISHLVQNTGNNLLGLLQNITNNTLYTIFISFIMIYTLCFLFLDGEEIIASIQKALPLQKKITEKLILRFGETIKSTLGVALLIGFLQAILGGLLFYVLPIPAPLLWAILIFLMALIPAIGCNVVLVPLALIMFLLSRWQEGLIILVGALVLNIIDYILRPRMIGKRTVLHPLLVLFSTLGGLAVFGLIGFLIGPVIAAFFVTLWQLLKEEIKP